MILKNLNTIEPKSLIYIIGGANLFYDNINQKKERKKKEKRRIMNSDKTDSIKNDSYENPFRKQK